MGVRIQGSVMTGVGYPVQRPDRGLLIWFGWWPESMRDDDVMFSTWAIDPWPVRSGDIKGEGAQMFPITNRVTWVEDIRNSGSNNAPYRIAGYVKNSVGVGVGNAVVNLCRSADDVIVDTQRSQPDGLYSFEVYDTTTPYYVEAYQLAPALAGMSVRTLVGA